MTGLELLEHAAIAVSVDEAGRVLARAESETAASLASAVFGTLEKLPGTTPTALAVASLDPESPGSAAVMKALVGRFAGPFLHDPPISSGTAAAAAEAWIGAARGAKHVVFFGVGDRTSAGIIREGAPVTGVHHRAPAVAWLALNPVDREQYRKVGCLEAEVAAPGIVRRMIRRVKAGDHSSVQQAVSEDLSAITLNHVLAAARGGDGVAISVMRDTAKYLGMASANLVAIADPEVLVLGGIMASAADLLLDAVRSEIGHHLPPSMMQALTIAPGALGADAPAIGAVRLAAASRP